MSVFSGLSRPLKAAGVALVGIAVVAAVIGFTALGGGGSNDQAGQTPSSQPGTTGNGAQQPTSKPAPPTSTPSSPTSTPASPPPGTSGQPGQPGTGQPGQPGQGQPGPGKGPDQQASNKWVTLRVYNNSTIKGLAARAADDFRGDGWTVAEVSNYPQGVIPATTAYFRPGTDEEAAAKQLASEFGFKAEPRFPGIEQSSPGVIVIVTNNYQTNHNGS